MFCVPEESLVSEEGETIFLNEILHFELIDTQSTYRGIIEGFSSNGLQDLLQVKVKDQDRIVEIPFVKEFISEIQFEEKKVLMSLPPGIWEVL
jgi:ribosomal 30S subunit maturation factor RimM